MNGKGFLKLLSIFYAYFHYTAINIKGVLGNKCAGQHNLKTVHFREKLASGNFLAWLSAVCVFFAALYLP
jgi:hypothetical protein